MNDKNTRILLWMVTGVTGTSSMTMAIVALGLRDQATQDLALKHRWDAPHDPSDFSRCYHLVQYVPEIRDDFDAIVEACPAFAPILRDWDDLCRIYTRDLPLDSSMELFRRLRTLRGRS